MLQTFMWNLNGEFRFALNFIGTTGADGQFNLTNEPYFGQTGQYDGAQWIHWKVSIYVRYQLSSMILAEENRSQCNESIGCHQ